MQKETQYKKSCFLHFSSLHMSLISNFLLGDNNDTELSEVVTQGQGLNQIHANSVSLIENMAQGRCDLGSGIIISSWASMIGGIRLTC